MSGLPYVLAQVGYGGPLHVPLRITEDGSSPLYVYPLTLPAAGLFQAQATDQQLQLACAKCSPAPARTDGRIPITRPDQPWRVACKEETQIAQKGGQSMSEWHNNAEMHRLKISTLDRLSSQAIGVEYTAISVL